MIDIVKAAGWSTNYRSDSFFFFLGGGGGDTFNHKLSFGLGKQISNISAVKYLCFPISLYRTLIN